MHILVGTDAQWVLDEVLAALGAHDTSFVVCRDGRDVSSTVSARTPSEAKDGGVRCSPSVSVVPL